MTFNLSQTIRDTFFKTDSSTITIDASYTSRDDVLHKDANALFVVLADLCKRVDEGQLIPFEDKVHQTRITINHAWHYRQVEFTIDNGGFYGTVSARFSWTIANVIQSLEARLITSWLNHMERKNVRRWIDDDCTYNITSWLSGYMGVMPKTVILLPPSAIWGKPSVQQLQDDGSYKQVTTTDYISRFFAMLQRETKKKGLVLTFEIEPETATTQRRIKTTVIRTDAENMVTQTLWWSVVDDNETLLNVLSTYLSGTPMKAMLPERAAYRHNLTEEDKVTTFLTTERKKKEDKGDGAVIRTVYGSPTFEDDVRSWIVTQAEEMGVA